MGLFEHIIRRLPLILSKTLVRAIYHLLRHRTLGNYLRKKNAALLNTIGQIRKILVISDVNIGDAIIAQSCTEALKHYLPDCEVDYAYNVVVDPIIKKNPQISNFFPIFANPFKPSKIESSRVRRLCREKAYDLVINLCPFLSGHEFRGGGCTALFPTLLIAEILWAKATENETANVAYRVNEYVNQLFSPLPQKTESSTRKCYYSGTKLYLSADALAARNRYLRSLGISPEEMIVYFNPDASNKYTLLDRDKQLLLLKRLLSQDSFDFLLLGPGITFKGIERYLFDKIPAPLREKLVVLDKKVSLDTYATLLDICDVFITGDTGPMHIAAARKICINNPQAFKNRTAIVEIFGSSEPRIYGYDSFGSRYAKANQDAPSKIFEASPPCKDITCSIQRVTNQCSKARCFDGIDLDEIVEYVTRYVSSIEE